jgi:MerR family mercuric resistance operon transcriptional regulator
MCESLTIGQLAQQGGVNVETIRYYQRRGILEEPSKPQHGFRSYPAIAVRRVHFIKRAQNLGFTLEEIRTLLDLDQSHACRETRSIAEHKLRVIDQKIEDLSQIRTSLSRLVEACDASSADASCPIIHLLADA